MQSIGSIQSRSSSARGSPTDVHRVATAPSRHAPTLATVADEAGVSRQTVSNALNSPELLRPDTLARVQEAIERLGYSPNRAARNLRTRASHLVGLRVDPRVEDSANALMDRFVHSLVESTREAGYHVLLFTGDGDDDPPTATTSCCAPRPSTRSWSPTPTAGNPQAAWLEQRACRSWRSAGPGGSPAARHPWVDVDGRAGRRASPSTTSSSAATAGSPGWAGRRARSSARTGAAAGSTGCTRTGCRPAGCRRARRRHPGVRPHGPRTRCSTDRGAADRVRVRQRHRGDGGAAGVRRARAAGRPATSRVVGFDDSIAAQVHHARADLGAAAARAGRGRGGAATSATLLAHRPIPRAWAPCSTPDAARPRDQLRPQ